MAHRSSSFSSYVSTNTVKTELDENNEEDHKAYLQEKIEPWLTWGFYLLSKERPDKPLMWFYNFLLKHKDDTEPPSLEISVDGESKANDNFEKHTKLSSMSTRAYLDATVVSYVTCGMHELYLEKPENPILWFANYFLKQTESNEPPKLV